MSEETQETKDGKAAGRQEARMQLDQVLADLVKAKEIEINISNKIREGMSKEINVDASKNVEVNVAKEEEKAASKPPARK